MGDELSNIVIKMRRGVIFAIKGSFRSVCNHPFLLFFLTVLIFMYRSSPFMFSLLVSASPVILCTAVLLGTLLFFGQPNIPEILIKEKTTHDFVPQKTQISREAIVEKNETYYAERFSEKRRDEAEKPTVESSLSESKLVEIYSDCSVDVTSPINKKRSQGIVLGNGEVLETKRDLDDRIEKQKTEWNDGRFSDGEVMENHYSSMRKVNDSESEYDKSEAESYDSEMVNVDSLESPTHSSWKQVKQLNDEEEDEASDSGSEQAESSSPDASMADIMPMLDELHPLLDEDAPQPIQMSRVGSEAPSERSPRSSTSSIESVDETENPEDSEVAEDDDDDDAQGDKDQAKSAIVWTEEDQKNLMNVGSSEIERNQRLENLILRRRTRKNLSMLPEINLIDLESSDFPVNIASISTARQNPFDLPHDSYDNSGLPPIPGSAPSILLPRRNPFDMPYDLSEEKKNLMGDGYQEELKLQSREPFFRRRESFNVGPSVFAPNRQERQDLKWSPYFVPEKTVLEEPSYSTLQRQSSEISDSKASSVPDIDSVSSVECSEDQKIEVEDDPQEVEVISRTEEIIEEFPLEDQDQVSKREFSEEDVPYESDATSEMKHVTENVGHGSQSSKGEECLELGSVKGRGSEVENLKFHPEGVEDHIKEGTVNQTGYNSSFEATEQRLSRGSSASSLSEVSERVFTKIDGEDSSMLDGRARNVAAVEPDISRQTSDLSTTSASADDIPHKDPVYDSSPPAVGTLPAKDNMNSDFSRVDQRSDENLTEEKSVGDKNLGDLVEEKLLSISEREAEGQLEVEDSIDNGETVQSPNSDSDYHEACEKITTPLAGSTTTTTHFYVRAMHELEFEHADEVQVPNTPVEPSEKQRGIQSIHIPELHKLDRDNTGSLTDSVSKNSGSSEEAASHVETQTKNENADEFKEIHEGQLSVTDDESSQHESEQNRDGERLVSPHFTETSDTSIVEVNSVEVNEAKNAKQLENWRDGRGEWNDTRREAKIPQDPHSATSDDEKESSSKSSSKITSWVNRRLSTPF